MINPLEKVRPRVNHFNYKDHSHYVYVYLNPFREVQSKYRLPGQFIEFAYEPIYVGKGTSGKGYRLNQHIAEYLKNGEETRNHQTIHNETKKNAFKELEKNMKTFGHTNVKYPRDWEEYQKDWVIVIKALNNPDALSRFESTLIKTIGTVRRGTGPLVNALLG
jgi:hypothetical protein